LEHPNETLEVLAFLKLNEKKTLSPNLSFSINASNDEGVYSLYMKSMGHAKIIEKNSQKNNNKTIENNFLTVEENKWKNAQINKLNSKIGVMFASKPLFQLLTNPLIGPLTKRLVKWPSDCIVDLILQ
jgi:hypothetical protein